MGLKIFETDPDAKPIEREEGPKRPDIAFTIRNGMKAGSRPVSLKKFRFLADEATAEGLAELYGGKAEAKGVAAYPFHVMSDVSELEFVVSGPDAIEDKLIKWAAGGGPPEHECDGVLFLSPAEDKGQACGCPPTLAERKEAHKKKRGPGPSVQITLTLPGRGEDLGTGKYIGTAWSIAEHIHETKAALDQIEGEALCKLVLTQVSFTNDAGELIEYTKPEIKVIGSYADALAEQDPA